MGKVTRAVFTATAGRLRKWDMKAAGRVTEFIANSEYVRGRVRRFYGRESVVIHPPIDLRRAGAVREVVAGQHYLCAGRLVGYKRTELMVEACARLGRPLRVAGVGPELARLVSLVKKLGAEALVSFLGELSTEALWQEYASCRALLFAADEGFWDGSAGGAGVRAAGGGVWCGGKPGDGAGLKAGSAASSDGRVTGVYFAEQTVESVMVGILEFEAAEAAGRFDAEVIRGWAAEFATPVFLRRMREFVLEKVPGGGECDGFCGGAGADGRGGLRWKGCVGCCEGRWGGVCERCVRRTG